ncbi:MAG: M42 family peptidase [Candidatus Dadabacteria bacterium]|nr:M42 family peptidase [Candidatus Dadabacteria bacterium]NIQ14102.1 M42 family peptidase [Candidatus Dadabacteria bacterium]
MNIELLKKLCDTPGMPGDESKIRDIFVDEIKNHTEEITEDIMGNIIAHIPGDGPRLVIDAHMDEVGFMVHHIDKRGFLRVTPMGGIDPRVFYAQRLVVWGKEPLKGVVGAIPPHVSKSGNNKEVPEIEDCVIDLGLPVEKVKKLVTIGDLVSFDTSLEVTEDSVISKALDDRMGLFVALEALGMKPKINCDLYITATVQEEAGLRGARIISPVYEPDFAVALEGTVAMDVPGIADHKSLANVGKGPEIRLSDRYLVAHRPFSFFITNLAEQNNIPYQITVKRAGSTNATAMQVTGKGTRASVISVPTRYLHSPSSIAYKKDIEDTIKLVFNLIENINTFGK